MNKTAPGLGIICFIVCFVFAITQANQGSRAVAVPTGRILAVPVPGFIARTNSYPATIVLSPDGRYAAFLNQGYGTEKSGVRQSIALLDLSNNQVRDFPDDRLRGDEKTTRQSYFIGLGFSTDGKHLYASMGPPPRTASPSTSLQTETSSQNDSSPFLPSASHLARRSFSIVATPRPAPHLPIPPDWLF